MAYTNNYNRGTANTSNRAVVAKTGEDKKSEAVFQQLVKLSKTGKLTFSVGAKGLSIPANTRVTLIELSEKRRTALEASGKAKGFTGASPTHELIGFKIEPRS